MHIAELLKQLEGFDWDKGNRLKNWEKHQVTQYEAEQVFFNRPRLVAHDEEHSQIEPRFGFLGKTNKGRKLFVVFTVRQNKIRIISARDQNRKERSIYEKCETTPSV
ncbi:MAG: BrnT family toxin [Anaerolineales bacterium]|nr:BrnT family toxin [Anaerolineales bacterium]